MLFIASCVIAAGAAAAQPNREPEAQSPIGARGFDGVWAFAATTTAGNCPGLTPSSVTIEGGRVVSVNGGALSPWGYVESDGTFVARLTDSGGHISRAIGKLRSAAGTGAWSSSTDYCGGAWRASRGG